MISPVEIVEVTTIEGIGGLIQGALAFGINLVAVPLLLFVDPRLVPGPALVTGLVLAGLLAHRERSAVDVRGLGWILAGRLPGSVLGTFIVAVVSERVLGALAGGLVFAAAIASYLISALPTTPWRLVAAGTASGFMSTTASVGGPAVALAYQSQSGSTVRGTLAATTLVGSAISLVGLGFAGHFGAVEVQFTGIMLPGALTGYMLSRHLTRYVDRGWMRKLVVALCLVAGAAAVVRSALAG